MPFDCHAMAQAVSHQSLTTGLRFNLRPVNVGSVVNNVELGQVFAMSTFIFPSHYHSTNALYTFIHLPLTQCKFSDQECH